MRAEGSVFWYRVAICAVLFGALLALGSVTYSTVHTIAVRKYQENEDKPVVGELSRSIYIPVEQRIDRHEELISKLQNPIQITAERRKLATFYEELGNETLAQSNLVRAEESYLRACVLDPECAIYASRVAKVYELSAVKERTPSLKITFLQNSATYWRSAARLELDEEQRMTYAENTARVLFKLGEAFYADGQTSQARQELEQAKATAPPGSKYPREADRLAWELDADAREQEKLQR